MRLRPRELLATLRRHDVDFVVIGAFALAPHGYVRATADLDIVPDPDPGNLRKLAAALRDLDVAEPDEHALTARANGELVTKHGRLDVMQDVPGLRSWARLRDGAVEVDGILYAGYDELISMKVASGREEDLRDVGALEAARRDD